MGRADTPGVTRPRSGVRSAIVYGIVLTVALAALAGVFWMWRESSSIHREIRQIRVGLGQLNGKIENLSRQMVRRDQWLGIKTRLDRQRTRELALEKRLGTLEGRVASDPEQLALQAASLLLHVGARLAPLEPDARGMRGLLVTVRELLAPWPSSRLMPLRQLLTADIKRLDAFSKTPSFRPERVLAELALTSPHWPLIMPRPPPSRIPRVARGHGFWARAGEWVDRLFASLVRIRSLPERVPPPPGPREAARIRLRLALEIVSARIDWLSGRRKRYEAELGLLRRLILRHYEPRDLGVKEGLAELAEIQRPHRPFSWAPLIAALRAARIPVVAPVRSSP